MSLRSSGVAVTRTKGPRMNEVTSLDEAAQKIVSLEEEASRAAASLIWEAANVCDRALPPTGDPSFPEQLTRLHAKATELGSDQSLSTFRSYVIVARRNPEHLRFGVSFTAVQEAGEDERRFDWFRQYGATLSKRDVRRLRGDRKLDTAATSRFATPAERQAQVAQLVTDMDEDQVAELVSQRPEFGQRVFQHVGRQITEDRQNRVQSVRDSVEGGTTLTTGELISRGLSLATAVDRWFREIERESLTDDQRQALAVAARKIINNATAAEAALGLPEDVVAALLTSEENS
jgi:hypothetical protein